MRFYEVYTWFGHVFRLFFNSFFFYFWISAHFTSAEITGVQKQWCFAFFRGFRRWETTVTMILNLHSIFRLKTRQNTSDWQHLMPDRPVFDRFWGFSKGLPGRHDIFMQGKYAKRVIFYHLFRFFRRWETTVKVFLDSHSISKPKTRQKYKRPTASDALFLTVFEAFRWAFREDWENQKKGGGNVKKKV